MAKTNKITIEELSEFTGQIIDVFEDFLEERGINLENSEKDERTEGCAAIIYGSDYGELQEGIEEILSNWNLIDFGKNEKGE